MHSDLTDDQLREKALAVLNEHLGTAQTVRFLSWLRSSGRDYQAWRDAHFNGVSVDELVTQIRQSQANQPSAGDGKEDRG